MRELPDHEKKEYRQEHFAHRLTLLRTFSARGPKNAEFWNRKADLFRCAKDSALISIRLFLSAMGLKGVFDQTRKDFVLVENARLRNCREYDDILIDQLGGKLPDPAAWSLRNREARLLAGVYKRADKELAHLTATFNDEFNMPGAIDEAARLVERLLREHLYDLVHEQMPDLKP